MLPPVAGPFGDKATLAKRSQSIAGWRKGSPARYFGNAPSRGNCAVETEWADMHSVTAGRYRRWACALCAAEKLRPAPSVLSRGEAGSRQAACRRHASRRTFGHCVKCPILAQLGAALVPATWQETADASGNYAGSAEMIGFSRQCLPVLVKVAVEAIGVAIILLLISCLAIYYWLLHFLNSNGWY